jgi:hypothetical protein
MQGIQGLQGKSGVASGVASALYGSFSWHLSEITHSANSLVVACAPRDWGDQVVWPFAVYFQSTPFTGTPSCVATLYNASFTSPKLYAPVVSAGEGDTCAPGGSGPNTPGELEKNFGLSPTGSNTITVSIGADQSCDFACLNTGFVSFLCVQ